MDTRQASAAIKAQAKSLGFDACGMAQAGPVPAAVRQAYEQWLASGSNACMAWAANWPDVRFDTTQLLPGARTVISLAVNYNPSRLQPAGAPQLACYALGLDYHDVVRGRALELAQFVTSLTGGQCRVCVDSAPILERYWAQRAGVGFVGRNHMLIVPGVGSWCFLCEIVTTAQLPPDEPCTQQCQGCNACLRACPGQALSQQGLDARRCLSCLTIEDRSPQLPQWASDAMGNVVYGCDRCQLVCPHNRHAPATSWPEFEPSPSVMELTAQAVGAMTQPQFSAAFKGSPVKRAKLAGLQRNTAHLLGPGPEKK